MPKYRRKPVEYDAVQFTGNNYTELLAIAPQGFVTEDGEFYCEGRCAIGDWVVVGPDHVAGVVTDRLFRLLYELSPEEHDASSHG